jgi:hypothetical protein
MAACAAFGPIRFVEAPQVAAYNAPPFGEGDFSPDFSGLM